MRQNLQVKLIRGRGTCKLQNKDIDLRKSRIVVRPAASLGLRSIAHTIAFHGAHEATITVRLGLRTGQIALEADIDPTRAPIRRPAVRRSSCNCGR